MSRNRTGYVKGALWFMASLCMGCGNDMMTRYVSLGGVDPLTIAFWRLAIGTLTLVPWVLYAGKGRFEVGHLGVHLVRGVLTFFAVALWIVGVSRSSVVTATLVSFTMPILSFVLGPWILGEGTTRYVGVATWLGFLGTFITLYPAGLSWDAYAVFFVLATLCFFALDILTKKYASCGSRVDMLFYANLVASACACVPWCRYGVIPPRETWVLLGMLGLGSNVLLYCLLTAYRYAPLTALAPLRYFELVLAVLLSYVCFAQVPTWYEGMGGLVIIPTGFWVVYLGQLPKDKG